MADYEENSWVWKADDVEMYLPAKVKSTFKQGEEGKVKTEDGETHKIDAKDSKDLLLCNPEVLDSKIDNLIKLNDLNEQAILHNLRIRFKEDNIYTYVSSILISVNPFKLLPLYTPEILDKYKEQGGRNLPPHVFAIADNAFKSMIADNKSQSVVISGESGAGKTEATKLILQFLAEVSGRASAASGEGGGGLEQQILQANPVMEAFGNAKTSRNNNSSRFGKLISVKFNNAGSIIGGSIINYLLEKSRVVFQNEGERNYHIFYQLLAGCAADPALRTLTGCSEAADYHYLNQSGVINIEGMSDEKEYEEMLSGMKTVSIDEAQRTQINKICAAILFLGNVTFVKQAKATEEDGAKVADRAPLDAAAVLLEVEPDALNTALCSRNIGNRSVIQVAYTIEQANDARDATTKMIFAKLFDWLIVAVNKSLAEGADLSVAGIYTNVLDIFGFESFETNSFEQLCINFCNEKLQFHFNEHIFRLEQDEYKKEGVTVADTAFVDNQPTLDLLEMNRTGVFSMIDEEINVPKGSDDGVLQKILRDHGKHTNLNKPKPKDLNARLCFNVVHFAGEVSYNITNFLEKNKDSLHDDIQGVLKSSSGMVKGLMTVVAAGADAPKEEASGGGGRGRPARGGGSKGKKATLGSQFKKQLNSLMVTLNATAPHFVRTMKSNDKKKGDIFETPRMLQQLRYAGLLEVCRIRQIGFPVRRDFEEFLKRYKPLSTKVGITDANDLCIHLESQGDLVKGEWAKGNSKIFLRNKMQADLEEKRELAFTSHALKIQKSIKGKLYRIRYAAMTKTVAALRGAIDGRQESGLEAVMDQTAELPYKGGHIPIVKEGRALLIRLQEESRVNKLLENAMEAHSLSDLEAAIATAGNMAPAFTSESVDKANAMLDQLKKEKACKEALVGATKDRDLAKLGSLLDEAKALGVRDDDEAVVQARALKERLDLEAKTVADLKTAIGAKNFEDIDTCLKTMSELGIDKLPEYKEGQTMKEELIAVHNAKTAMVEAGKKRDLALLGDAIDAAAKLGVSGAEMDDAKKVLDQLQKEKAAEGEISAANEKRDLATVEAALAKATALGMTAETSAKFKEGTELVEQLGKEAACRTELAAATAANDVGKLSAALQTAATLGVTGSEFDAAKAARAKLAEANAAGAALLDAAGSGDLDKINAALEEADAKGMGDCAEAQECRTAKERLLEERSKISSLKAAMEASDLTALTKAFADCQRMQLASKFGEVMDQAKAAMAKLEEESKVNNAMEAGREAGDIDAMKAGLAKAEEMKIENDGVKKTKLFVETLDAMKAELAKEEKDLKALAKLVATAKQNNMQGDTVQSTRIVVEREDMLKEAKQMLKKGTDTKNLDMLQKALEKVIQLGIEDHEGVTEAKALRDKLSASTQQFAALVSAMKTATAVRESPAGIAQSDLGPLQKVYDETLGGTDDKDAGPLEDAKQMLAT